MRHKLRTHGPTDPKEAAEQPDQTTAAAAAGAAQIGAEPNANDTEQTVSDGADVTQGVSAPPGKSTSAQPAARSGTSKEPEHISARATDGNPWPDGIDDSGDSAISDDEEDAIDFFGQSSKPAFDFDLPPRGVWIAAGALTVLLALQLAIGARDSLAALFPAAKPVLQTVSESLGLTVNLPLRADAIRIESHDLASASAPGTRGDKSNYVLNLLIRNHADTTLRWPAIELTLTDRTGANILIRKALMPADYLADASRADSGMPARSEKSLRLNLRVRNNLPMHGYTAVLFYP